LRRRIAADAPFPPTIWRWRATALHLDFAVLVGPLDDAHFRAVDGLRVQTLDASASG
jgi:hypothetical protein